MTQQLHGNRVVFTSERQVQLQDFTLDAALGPREALVRGKYSVISPGTEGSQLHRSGAADGHHARASPGRKWPSIRAVSTAHRLRALGRSARRRQRGRGRTGR